MSGSAGGKDRAEQHPLLPIAMDLKLITDSATAIQLGREEWKEIKKRCFYCQVATFSLLASLAIAAPEVIRAIKQIARKPQFYK